MQSRRPLGRVCLLGEIDQLGDGKDERGKSGCECGSRWETIHLVNAWARPGFKNSGVNLLEK